MNVLVLLGWRIALAAGGPPKVDPQGSAALQAAVNQDPRSIGALCSTWTCAALGRHLAERVHLLVSPEPIRRHLHRLGFRVVRPVLHVRSHDPEFIPKATRLATVVAHAEAGVLPLLVVDTSVRCALTLLDRLRRFSYIFL